MRFSSRLAIVGSVLVLVAAPSVGCKRIAGVLVGKAEKSAGISEDGKGTLTYRDPKNPGSSLTLGSKEAPAEFPKSIPLYPGAKLSGGATIAENGKTITNVGMQTKDTPDQVATFYKARYGTSEYQDTNDLANNPVGGFIRAVTFTDAASGSKVVMELQVMPDQGTAIQINASIATK